MLSPHLPHVKWILPNAHVYSFATNDRPNKSVTCNGGFRMPAWYDIVSLDRDEKNQDEKGMLESMESSK